MTDIVDRLRDRTLYPRAPLMREAAAEIERLRRPFWRRLLDWLRGPP